MKFILLSLCVSGCAARGVEVSVDLPGGEGSLRDGQHPGAQGLDRRRLPDAPRAQQASQIGGKMTEVMCDMGYTEDAF